MTSSRRRTRGGNARQRRFQSANFQPNAGERTLMKNFWDIGLLGDQRAKKNGRLQVATPSRPASAGLVAVGRLAFSLMRFQPPPPRQTPDLSGLQDLTGLTACYARCHHSTPSVSVSRVAGGSPTLLYCSRQPIAFFLMTQGQRRQKEIHHWLFVLRHLKSAVCAPVRYRSSVSVSPAADTLYTSPTAARVAPPTLPPKPGPRSR